MQRVLLTLVVAAQDWHSIWAFPGGAPSSTCDSMTPSEGAHGRPARTDEPPYELKAELKENKKVMITISGKEGAKFKGFFLQARCGNKLFEEKGKKSHFIIITLGIPKLMEGWVSLWRGSRMTTPCPHTWTATRMNLRMPSVITEPMPR